MTVPRKIERRYRTDTFLVESPLENGGRITIELPIDITANDVSRAARILMAVAPEQPKQLTAGPQLCGGCGKEIAVGDNAVLADGGTSLVHPNCWDI